MKNIYKIIILFIVAIGLNSCNDDEYFELQPKVETFEIVTPTNGSTVVLDDTNLSNTAFFISWNDPSGNGSTYNIEIAEAGTEFETPFLLGTSEGSNFSMTVDELNTFLLDEMGINPDEANKMEIKVSNSSEATEAITVLFTPFTVEYTELFLVGTITDPQWKPEDALPMTRLDFNKFEITIDLVDGDEFKFIPTNIDFEGDLGEDPDNAGHLIEEGEQNLSGYSAGKYKITVDLNTFTFEVEEIIPPATMFLVGAGVPDAGWGWDTPVELTLIEDGVFQGTASFANDAFRFFSEEGNWDSGTNYPYYVNEGYTIDSNFEDALDDDNNFKFIGTPGEYTITLDNNNKTITLTAPGPKYMVGAGVPDAGWGWDTPVEMEQVSAGKWAVTTNFINDAFRFFDIKGDWDSGSNYPFYADAGYTIDSNLEDALDGDNNFKFIGTPGMYTIILDSNNKTITLEEPSTSKYIVGAGVPDAGWGWDTPIEMLPINSGVWEATTTFSNDAFRFFDVEGDWDSGSNYLFYANAGYTIDSNLEDALDGDNNFKFIGTPGAYTITLDSNNKTITLTALASKYMVGAGVPNAGWAWDTPIEMVQVSAGVWEAKTDFANDAFRFFDVEGDWDSGSNYPFYANAGYSIDSNLEDALDGDNNFKFIGTPGEYTITLDSNNKTITLSN